MRRNCVFTTQFLEGRVISSRTWLKQVWCSNWPNREHFLHWLGSSLFKENQHILDTCQQTSQSWVWHLGDALQFAVKTMVLKDMHRVIYSTFYSDLSYLFDATEVFSKFYLFINVSFIFSKLLFMHNFQSN